MINWGLVLLDALVDLAILRGRWRRALALEHAQPAPDPPLDARARPQPDPALGW
jgi:hypothetical protein